MSDGGFPRSVTIYGTGLMGASLALALKERIPGIRIFGVDKPEVLSSAQRLGAVDAREDAGEDAGAPEASDLVVLAAPVGAILELIDQIPANRSLVLDVGSTKSEICKRAAARRLPFLGGHPMTGSERSGPEAASPDLFRDTPFFLCPIPSTPPDAITSISRLVETIGAQPVVMEAEKHDSLVAQLSHLPQILSTVLADQTGENRAFAGPGWKSLTRLGASPFHIWRDILQTSDSLPAELKAFIDRLQSVLDALNAGNMDKIQGMFERANLNVSEEGNE